MKNSHLCCGATERLTKLGAPLALVAALSACTNMSQTPPNTPLAAIEADYGAPDYRCTTDSGQQRVIWTQQPMGQYAWAANISTNGSAISVDQVLSDTYFKQLSEGLWTPERVRCTFGPPAKIEQVGMP